ncbi:ABC transporter permease [Planktomarina sp.]|jgi:putative spermidine/putrescine transport system permease protein|nr:ABC transporter permease [Planktomarina sp.]|tara:strand:- start:274 stop:1098 length:825 start_codon:yes stop_codon:yes gene_type:complete
MVMKEKLGVRSFRVITGAVLITWLILPLIPMAIWSFAKGWFYPNLLPQNWSLRAWEYAMSDTAGVIDSLWLTIWISVVATVLSILVGVPAGRALGMYKFKGKEIIELMILAPTIVPGIAVVLGIHSVFISFGLNNTISGVILVHLIPTLPYMVLVMSGIFANYDPAFEAQARSLGASQLKTFWYVTLPAIRPGIIVGGLFAFLVSWSQYILTLLIGGGRVETLPLLLFNFATAGRNDITGAIGIIYILPGIIILLLTAKHLSGRSGAVGGFGQI